MTSNPPPLMVPEVAWAGPPSRSHNPWGLPAYILACLGPFAPILMAATYPPTHPKELPSLSVQICWWVLALSSPLGIVIGAIAYGSVRRAKQRVTGGSFALAAMVVGCMASLALAETTRILTAQCVENHRGNRSCLSNLKQLGTAMVMYAQDYDEHDPPCASWNALTMAYIKTDSVYHCPDQDVETVPSYGMNRQLNMMFIPRLTEPATAISLFDSIPGADRAGGKELLPNPSRYRENQNVGFADGHAKAIPDTKIDSQQWIVKIAPKAIPEKPHAASQGGSTAPPRESKKEETGQVGEKK